MSESIPGLANKEKMVYPLQKVMIAEDHDIFRHGLKTLLNKYSFIELKGEATNGPELMKLVAANQPDIIFMDLHMPGGDGVEASEIILQLFPNIKIVVLSFYDDALTVKKMLKLGVSAYLTKSMSMKLLDAMFEKILNGETFISPDAETKVKIKNVKPGPSVALPQQIDWLTEDITARQKQVLKLISEGLSHKQIGLKLELSERTIETHKENLIKKFGAKNVAELISIAHEHKLI